VLDSLLQHAKLDDTHSSIVHDGMKFRKIEMVLEPIGDHMLGEVAHEKSVIKTLTTFFNTVGGGSG
jgi:hypothetical protein